MEGSGGMQRRVGQRERTLDDARADHRGFYLPRKQSPSRELKRMTKARPQLLHPRMLLEMVLALHMRVGSLRKAWHPSALPSTPRACASLFTAP